MTFRLTNGGSAQVLTLVAAVNMTVRLYSNDVEGVLAEGALEDLDETDFTECTFAGYSASAVTSTEATVTTGSGTTTSDLTYDEVTFERTTDGTAENAYGYYVTRDSDSALVWYDNFEEGPYSIEFDGDGVRFSPTWTLD